MDKIYTVLADAAAAWAWVTSVRPLTEQELRDYLELSVMAGQLMRKSCPEKELREHLLETCPKLALS